MAGRSPARFLAPIALVAFAFAFYSILQDGRESSGGDSGTPARTTESPTPAKKSSKKSSKKKRKSYTVKAGDTPSGIAEKVGVSLDTLYELNPDLDPQTLAPGQRIKLTR
ncbi:MAG TPA: LysM domain-containing protein [Solirubrobacter sp.]|jgi:LysM repeat protein|nr:LysM domain-containing protein [Solirubrobacter sp.]